MTNFLDFYGFVCPMLQTDGCLIAQWQQHLLCLCLCYLRAKKRCVKCNQTPLLHLRNLNQSDDSGFDVINLIFIKLRA